MDPLPPPLDPLLEPELPLLLPPLPLPPLLLPPLPLPPLPLLLDESLLEELDDDEPLSLLLLALEPPLDDESLDAFDSGFVDE